MENSWKFRIQFDGFTSELNLHGYATFDHWHLLRGAAQLRVASHNFRNQSWNVRQHSWNEHIEALEPARQGLIRRQNVSWNLVTLMKSMNGRSVAIEIIWFFSADLVVSWYLCQAAVIPWQHITSHLPQNFGSKFLLVANRRFKPGPKQWSNW